MLNKSLYFKQIGRAELCLRIWLVLLLGLVLGMNLFSASPVLAKSDTLLSWRDTGLKYPDRSYDACLDPTLPATLYVAKLSDQGFSGGTEVYDLNKGTHTPFSNYIFNTCDKYNGLLYHTDGIRFDKNEPQGRFITHTPQYFATDGSLQMYALQSGKIFASSDGGINWEARSSPQASEEGEVASIAISGLDPKLIYALEVFREKNSSTGLYSLFNSVDAGTNWTKLYSGQTNNPQASFIYLNAIDSYNKPDILTLSLDHSQLVSIDGGHTFQPFDIGNKYKYVEYFQMSQGILSLSTTQSSEQQLELSFDGAKTFSQKMSLPFKTGLNGFGKLIQLNGAPDTFLLYNAVSGGDFLWYSNDGAQSWQKLAPFLSNNILITQYLPTVVYSSDSRTGEIYALDLPSPGINQTKGGFNNQAPAGSFFPQTKHNLGGIFKKYWQAHGGLGQFGLPKTEPVREVNPVDGKVYLVQYFERSRMEYHPELAGSGNEVELGLIGRQETTNRSGDAAFKPIAVSVSYPSHYYFSQTSHSVSNGFLNYWLKNGGLSQFGYPISEEFDEKNPGDGKLHTVQYFERGRFEYYPEYNGTDYEVQLGLLGNSLLQQKGWLH